MLRIAQGDLRSLDQETLRAKLRTLGVPDDKIKRMDRWDQVKLLRELTNKYAKKGDGSENFKNY